MDKTTTNLTQGTAQGTHVSGTPLTTDLAAAASPSLLTNAIDAAIVKIRPMATPLDQISRLGHTRQIDSIEVDYYSIDTRTDTFQITTVQPHPGTDAATPLFEIETPTPQCIEISETFKIGDTICYIIDKTPDAKLICTPIDSTQTPTPGTAIRMGRAATQLDVQTPQFAALPMRQTNICQIFKMQVEQSAVMRMSHKEIGWDITDQQEAALYDMRLGMEKQFLFGKKGKIYDPQKQENVTFTEGIWSQAGKDITISTQDFNSTALIEMLRQAFTENSGSRRKILIAGSGLIAAINKIENTHVITARDQVTAWGIDFSELQSKFGRLYVIFSDIFDIMGTPDNGIIIDPEYIQKHIFIPFTAERLDLRGSGQRNTEAIVLTEASCLTLRYPEAHARITGI